MEDLGEAIISHLFAFATRRLLSRFHGEVRAELLSRPSQWLALSDMVVDDFLFPPAPKPSVHDDIVAGSRER